MPSEAALAGKNLRQFYSLFTILLLQASTGRETNI